MTAGDPSGRPRIVIADDEVLLRDGLALLLRQSGFDVVGTAADATQLERVLAETPCDLVIVDIRMPPTNTTEGLVAARHIHDDYPRLRVLVLSSYIEVEHAVELLSGSEGIGYLLKQRVSAVGEFVSALHRVLQGEAVIDPELVRELLQARRTVDPLAVLTPRERDVLELMAQGRSNGGVAATLHLSEATVEKYVHRILNKLDLTDDDGSSNRRVLAVLALLDNAGSKS
ncbi:response regulator transcription factor [Herbiconiux sp. VKM Ac-1786]|uniref:response regulator n=1 Tax=Herbiconiux sp. VKM Ac-1786 TaxID=2783824 RepID=UPI00188AE284|nr:response regulator transcription factor [Herbiconiux sp. VKM Ac-1786]MBF4571830.1 response regulator transcription factor [Herbiconiux sp. VKM Ac-1786]